MRRNKKRIAPRKTDRRYFAKTANRTPRINIKANYRGGIRF